MSGVLRNSSGDCACCGATCQVLLGPFCGCCGPENSASVRLYDGLGFDQTFPIVNGYAAATVPKPDTFHVQTTGGGYTTRSWPDMVVSLAGSGCTASPIPSGYVPPDRPATLTATAPDGTAITLTACDTATGDCTSGQYRHYQGTTSVTLTHGCWCGTASPSVTIPVVVRWDFGPPCRLSVWVPVCYGPADGGTVPASVALKVCGFAVTAPGTCVDPSTQVIPTPAGASACSWVDIAAYDVTIYDQPTTCAPFYYRSGAIPAFSNTYGTCLAQSASSFVWPGGGYWTVTP